MKRFIHEKSSFLKNSLFRSLLLSLPVLLIFTSGISSVTDSVTRQQKQNLEQAIQRSIVQCYITQGTYPESLEYLEAHYPLIYDKDTFLIDYQPIGENIMPNVTILVRK